MSTPLSEFKITGVQNIRKRVQKSFVTWAKFLGEGKKLFYSLLHVARDLKGGYKAPGQKVLLAGVKQSQNISISY